VAVVREGSKVREDYLGGARILYSDVTDEQAISNTVFKSSPADVVISCLASRSGSRLRECRVSLSHTQHDD
jgi:hypothetical protein